MLENDRASGLLEVGSKPVEHQLVIEMHGHQPTLDSDLEMVPLAQRIVDRLQRCLFLDVVENDATGPQRRRIDLRRPVPDLDLNLFEV